MIEEAVRAAATAPSGANLQPWRFVVVTDRHVKSQIREAAEAEEREFYQRRASEEWLEALHPLGTDWHKPFLEIAPVLIVVFEVHKGPTTPRPYIVRKPLDQVLIWNLPLLVARQGAGALPLTMRESHARPRSR